MVQAMEKLVDQGLVKHIGVSNFSVKKLKDLLTYARIKPAVNQIEVHPYFRNDYNIDWCRSQARIAETPACAYASIQSVPCLDARWTYGMPNKQKLRMLLPAEQLYLLMW